MICCLFAPRTVASTKCFILHVQFGLKSQRASYVFLQFNFVGKLLGPRGNSLKRLQEETLTKMSILGKGSMRDKTKVRPVYVSEVLDS